MGYISEVAKAWLGVDNTHLDVDDAELQLFLACVKKPEIAAKLIVEILKEAKLLCIEENVDLWLRIACGPLVVLKENFPVVGADMFRKLIAENPTFAAPIRLCINELSC